MEDREPRKNWRVENRRWRIASILNLPSSIFYSQYSILNLPSSVFHPQPSPLAAGRHNCDGSIDGGQTDDRRRVAKLNHAWTIPRPHGLLALNRSALNR